MVGEGIQIPGRVALNVQAMPGPNANPAVVTMGGAGTVNTVIVGGLTKLDVVAAQIYAATRAGNWVPGNIQQHCEQCVEEAMLLLAACNRVHESAMASMSQSGASKIEAAQ